MTKLLQKIKSPADIKGLNYKELASLATEIRAYIIKSVSENGGHLASNLGVVELTIALHRAFDSPKDAIIFDVSHQSYTHKLLTGRYLSFEKLRQKGGISGFTKHNESPHDYFDNGHASTAISQGLGLVTAWNLKRKEKEGKKKSNKDAPYVVVVVGDGALTGGISFEGLLNAGGSPLSSRLIIILNDNQMSIDRSTGSFSKYLSRLTMTRHYQRVRRLIDKVAASLPFINKALTHFIMRFKRGLKGLFLSNNIFSNFNFEYVGPLDGHNIKELESTLKLVKSMESPVVIHVLTKKGKGYTPAEVSPQSFHGVERFHIEDGSFEKFDTCSFTQAFSDILVEKAKTCNKLVAITAAMTSGAGLSAFAKLYPERFFDVGIAEEHAVSFAAGLAKGGLLPCVSIYSTFIQRAVDCVICDAALQDLPIIFVLSRAGVVPADGETHQGLFDISLFRSVPNLILTSPASREDLKIVFNYAVKCKKPIIIRLPKLSTPTELPIFSATPLSDKQNIGRGVLVKAEVFCPSLAVYLEDNTAVKKVLFITTGSMFSEVLVTSRALLMKNIISDIYTLRFITPFDSAYFIKLIKGYNGIVFVEDNYKEGGISEHLALLATENGYNNFKIKAFPSKYFSQGTREEVLEEAKCSPLFLQEAAEEVLNREGL